MNNLARIIATWFGCGLAPVAPGTAGSLGALVIAWPLAHWLAWPAWSFAILALVLTPLSIWAASRAAALAGQQDPGFVVVDEVLGQWVALAGAPALDLAHTAAAFVLFRFFDIVKPWPVRRLESLDSGTGIVADDLMAGVYAALVLSLARWFNL